MATRERRSAVLAIPLYCDESTRFLCSRSDCDEVPVGDNAGCVCSCSDTQNAAGSQRSRDDTLACAPDHSRPPCSHPPVIPFGCTHNKGETLAIAHEFA